MTTSSSAPATPPVPSAPTSLPPARPRVRRRNRLADYPPVEPRPGAVPVAAADSTSPQAVASAPPASPDAIQLPPARRRERPPALQGSGPPTPAQPEPAPAPGPASIPALPAAGAAAGCSNDGPGRDYDVGYGKPPKHSRFKPGQSGNPAGRSKGAKGVNTIVREAMTRKVQVRTAQGTTKMTRAEVMIEKAIELAMKGDPRALAQMLARYAAAVPDAPVEDNAVQTEDMTATDLAMLEALRLRHGAPEAPMHDAEAAGALCATGGDTPAEPVSPVPSEGGVAGKAEKESAAGANRANGADAAEEGSDAAGPAASGGVEADQLAPVSIIELPPEGPGCDWDRSL